MTSGLGVIASQTDATEIYNKKKRLIRSKTLIFYKYQLEFLKMQLQTHLLWTLFQHIQ